MNDELRTFGGLLQHPVFAQVARLLRFDRLGLLMHGQVAVAHIAV